MFELEIIKLLRNNPYKSVDVNQNMETVEFLNFFLNLREKVEIVKYSNFPSEYCFAIC